MKTSKRTIVLMTVELSEVDLDIAIDNYPKVERQILEYVGEKTNKPWQYMDDVSISMTIEFKTNAPTKHDPVQYAHIDDPTKDNTLVGPFGVSSTFSPDGDTLPIQSDPHKPTPDTETKDQLMDPGTMIENLAKDYKPSPDDEEF